MKSAFKKVSMMLLTLTLFLSLTTTAFAGLSEPKKTWDLKEKGKYTFEGNASISDLYSNYLFTGATRVEIKVNNKGDEELTVKLFEKDAWFFCETSADVPEDGSTVWKYKDLDEDEKYYLQFYAPCKFDGYIKTY